MRWIPVLLSLVLLLPACSRPKGPPVPVAGLYALQGGGKLVRPSKPSWGRTAAPGLTLASDMTLVLEGRAVLEGFNGIRVALGPGEHALGTIAALRAEAATTRKVYWVEMDVRRREVGALIVPSRYEPLPSGRPLPSEKEDLAGNMAVFFSPGGTDGTAEPEPVRGAPPPWAGGAGYVRALRRPVPPGNGERRLLEARGDVVVEFRDRATAYASELSLPVALDEAVRVVVVDGAATLALGPETLKMGSGDEAELR